MNWLALHGFTGSPASFARMTLPAKTTAPPLGGHRYTAASGDFDAEVERLAAEAEDARSLFGYSLGGRLALGLLARFPRRYDRAVLVSTRLGLSTPHEQAERREQDLPWIRLLRERGLAAFVRAWEAQPIWASQAELDAELRRQKHSERLEHDPEGLARSLESTGLGVMPDLRDRLRQVQSDIDILVGACDPKFVALGEELLTVLPQARLITVAEAGHDLLLERPELCSSYFRETRA